jgi:hypothetical protein
MVGQAVSREGQVVEAERKLKAKSKEKTKPSKLYIHVYPCVFRFAFNIDLTNVASLHSLEVNDLKVNKQQSPPGASCSD